MKTSDVFGISPEVRLDSYVDRGNLDSQLSVILGRTQHVAIRGPSKCGKSWLRQKVLRDAITVQCRLGKPSTDIYVDALSQLGIVLEIKQSASGGFRATLSASAQAGLSLLGKVGINLAATHERTQTTDGRTAGHDINDLRFVADVIKASGRRLVIEDFHYMSTEDRRDFAFDLKALWDYGLFVVIIGVWCETNLLLHLNPDLTGRVTEVSVDWSRDDLAAVLTKGGQKLGLAFGGAVASRLVANSYSNAGLLQHLTLLTLDEAGIAETGGSVLALDNVELVESACMMHADQLNPVYLQFAKRVAAGIRTRQNATGIYAHTMAVIMEAPDDDLVKGLKAQRIFRRAHEREDRIQFGNLKKILGKLQELQVDEDGRGLILGYSPATEEVTIVDRQLLLYRRYATVKWPWDDLVAEAEAQGGQLEAF